MAERDSKLIDAIISGTKSGSIDWQSLWHGIESEGVKREIENRYENNSFQEGYLFKEQVDNKIYYFAISEFFDQWIGEAGYPETSELAVLTIHAFEAEIGSSIIYEINDSAQVWELLELTKFNQSGLAKVFDTIISNYTDK